MPTTYKTPGVYVEEISIFPPSIAQVETAVPAFIGYTEKASMNGKNLHLEPTVIRSLPEFEEAFGFAPRIEVDTIELDNSNNVTSASLETGFLMYDSLRLFYANGGGKCHIISIGKYPATVEDADFEDFETGLAKLRKEDEPTLILFPDAVLLGEDKLFTLQQAALKQAAELQDRFVILDLYNTTDAISIFDRVEEFRDKIGITNLHYGAAYVPWLRTNLEKRVSYRHIIGHVLRGGVAIDLKGLPADSSTVDSLNRLEDAISDVNAYAALIGTNGIDAIESGYLALENDFQAKANNPTETIVNQREAYEELLIFLFNQLNNAPDAVAANTGAVFKSALIDAVIRMIEDAGPLHAAAKNLNSLVEHAGRIGAAGEIADLEAAVDVTTFDADEWGPFADTGNINDFYPTDTAGLAGDALATAQRQNMRAGATIARTIMKSVIASLSDLQDAAAELEKQLEASVVATFPLLKTIIRRAENAITELPPSAAIAGVYSAVDSTRGVFKAPANVSLSSVVGVTSLISHDEQQDLNVDVVAGKSINAIRPFTGKGILVWGARTLAGNDNEWRYISVRRFFNMVEESTKKATERFVFEPNDANTWIKVKTMIENFLINQWRAGALAGATPEEAFFVKVGLGQTMTPQDVLEGKLIVEIGMAAVRPAEFIILRFSHKLQTS